MHGFGIDFSEPGSCLVVVRVGCKERGREMRLGGLEKIYRSQSSSTLHSPAFYLPGMKDLTPYLFIISPMIVVGA